MSVRLLRTVKRVVDGVERTGRVYTTFRVYPDRTVYEMIPTGWRKVHDPRLVSYVVARARS